MTEYTDTISGEKLYIEIIGDNTRYFKQSVSKIYGLGLILHRVDGPALISNQDKFWYCNGKLHRMSGPAVEYKDGTLYWYIDGLRISKTLFTSALDRQ